MKVGFFAILGKPNAGKSTLTNALVGEKVSIVSWRPQTTRNKINGIVNGTLGGEEYQLVLTDTPGIQHGKDRLSVYMQASVSAAQKGSDGVVYVIDGGRRLDEEELAEVKRLAATTPKMVVAVNKMDEAPREQFVSVLSLLNGVEGVEIVPISAEKGENLDVLTEILVKDLPEGQPFYPDDISTDSTLRFMAGEIVREKVLKFLQDEIPHGVGVEIVKYLSREDGVEEIHADIICEKPNHKPIIIGKKGETLKRIATAARKEMEDLAGCPVFLKLWVKVRENWRQSPDTLSILGYDIKDLKDDE
ncbi:MAG: GTPase Era [Clostridia bacterium]|nr:GTPase Era [Clostridia bacterium]